jgi:hypothetical protein
MGARLNLDDAYSGGHSLQVETGKEVHPFYQSPFGHALPGWNFEIVEKPAPGQYRWVQFAWKGLAPPTTGASLLLGPPWPGHGVAVTAGEPIWKEGVAVNKEIEDTLPQEWQVVRVDLWDALKKPLNIQSLNLSAAGGPAAFDQIILGRSEADLPPIPKYENG